MEQATNKDRPSTLIYGRKPLIDALSDGQRIDKILIQRETVGEEINALKSLAARNGVTIQFVPKEKIDRVCGKLSGKQANHQGVLGFLALVEYYSLDDVLHKAHSAGEDPLLVILDGVTDVHNLGAIARSAECMGAHALVVPDTGSAQINPEAIKASAGALTKILICKEKSLTTAIKYLKACGIKIVATAMKGATDVSKTDLTAPCAIVMGSEGDGVSPLVYKLCDEFVFIPMKGSTESLNVSVSAGIILYEINKQRAL